jgi:hypothetical protein
VGEVEVRSWFEDTWVVFLYSNRWLIYDYMFLSFQVSLIEEIHKLSVLCCVMSLTRVCGKIDEGYD